MGHVFDIWASFINFQLHVVQEKNRHANICVKCCGVRPTSAASKSRKATTIQSTSRCSFADSHIHSCCFFFCRFLRQPLHLSLSVFPSPPLPHSVVFTRSLPIVVLCHSNCTADHLLFCYKAVKAKLSRLTHCSLHFANSIL